jgi:superfamily II DNA helicase RecQ
MFGGGSVVMQLILGYLQGLDLSNIEIVVQYLVPPSLSTLVQRLGRGGRDPGMRAFGIFLAEPKYFDDVKAAAEARAQARKKKRRKRGAGPSVSKRAAADVGGTPTPMTPRSEPVATEDSSSTEDSNHSSVESDASAEEMQQHAMVPSGQKTRTGQRFTV